MRHMEGYLQSMAEHCTGHFRGRLEQILTQCEGDITKATSESQDGSLQKARLGTQWVEKLKVLVAQTEYLPADLKDRVLDCKAKATVLRDTAPRSVPASSVVGSSVQLVNDSRGATRNRQRWGANLSSLGSGDVPQVGPG